MRSKAFESWLKQVGASVDQTSALLYSYAATGDSENLVWYYLKQTGSNTYTEETFKKAARIALGLDNSHGLS